MHSRCATCQPSWAQRCCTRSTTQQHAREARQHACVDAWQLADARTQPAAHASRRSTSALKREECMQSHARRASLQCARRASVQCARCDDLSMGVIARRGMPAVVRTRGRARVPSAASKHQAAQTTSVSETAAASNLLLCRPHFPVRHRRRQLRDLAPPPAPPAQSHSQQHHLARSSACGAALQP